MKEKFELTTPVLYLAFNRLGTVKKTFPEIRKAKPRQLFISCDGPRTEEEREKIDAVRKYILDNIDWKCNVKTLFRNKNLGCKYAVSSAIDWFFKNVKQGIILEDDCLPSQSFFRFCQEMLERYKDDERIMQISGTNVEGKSKIKEDYFFSGFFNAWGWATWRRAWDKYDVEMKEYENMKKAGQLKFLENPPFEGFLGKRLYRLLKTNKLDTWDYPWIFTCIINGGLCIVPKVNLIDNLGTGEDATHTSNYGTSKKLNKFSLNFPLTENKIIMENGYYKKQYSKFFKRGRALRFLTSLVGK